MTQIAVFGKHPSFGDFVAYGVPPKLRGELQTWVTEMFAGARAACGEDWHDVFDGARPVRFWLGQTILGQCLRGVLRPSRDTVGRRYPMIALSPDASCLPPPLASDQSVYEEMDAHLIDRLEQMMSDVAELGLGGVLPEQSTPQDGSLWAVNPDASPADLLQAVGTADYTRSAGARSYWWCAPDGIRSGAMWSCSGLASVDALLWLMSGVGRAPEPEQVTSEKEQMQTTTRDVGLD